MVLQMNVKHIVLYDYLNHAENEYLGTFWFEAIFWWWHTEFKISSILPRIWWTVLKSCFLPTFLTSLFNAFTFFWNINKSWMTAITNWHCCNEHNEKCIQHNGLVMLELNATKFKNNLLKFKQLLQDFKSVEIGYWRNKYS